MKLRILSWNVRGLNEREKRRTLKSLIQSWRADIVCIQETKINEWSDCLSQHLMGSRWAGWAELQAIDSRGGAVILWDKRNWNCIDIHQGSYTISSMLESAHEDFR